MDREPSRMRWTKAGWATILVVLFLLTSGCALGGKRTVAGASTLSYLPYRAATKPSQPTPYQAEPCYFGYHSAGWRSWPECWSGSDTFPLIDEGAEVPAAPSAEFIPVPLPALIFEEAPPTTSDQ